MNLHRFPSLSLSLSLCLLSSLARVQTPVGQYTYSHTYAFSLDCISISYNFIAAFKLHFNLCPERDIAHTPRLPAQNTQNVAKTTVNIWLHLKRQTMLSRAFHFPTSLISPTLKKKEHNNC